MPIPQERDGRGGRQPGRPGADDKQLIAPGRSRVVPRRRVHVGQPFALVHRAENPSMPLLLLGQYYERGVMREPRSP